MTKHLVPLAGLPLIFALISPAPGQVLPPDAASPPAGPGLVTPADRVSLPFRPPVIMGPSLTSHLGHNFSLASNAAAISKVDPAKAAEIHKILFHVGTSRLMGQMKTQMFATLEREHPSVLPHTWQRLEQEMDEKQLLDQLVPIYDRNFSLADLKAIDAFYSTPVGKRLLASMPEVTFEVMEVGREWARTAMMKVGQELRDERGRAGVAPGAKPPAK